LIDVDTTRFLNHSSLSQIAGCEVRSHWSSLSGTNRMCPRPLHQVEVRGLRFCLEGFHRQFSCARARQTLRRRHGVGTFTASPETISTSSPCLFAVGTPRRAQFRYLPQASKAIAERDDRWAKGLVYGGIDHIMVEQSSSSGVCSPSNQISAPLNPECCTVRPRDNEMACLCRSLITHSSSSSSSSLSRA